MSGSYGSGFMNRSIAFAQPFCVCFQRIRSRCTVETIPYGSEEVW